MGYFFAAPCMYMHTDYIVA